MPTVCFPPPPPPTHTHTHLTPPSQYPQESVPPTITCALYLTSFGRLVCGQADGCVAVLSANQAATVLMLQPRKFSRGKQISLSKYHLPEFDVLMHVSLSAVLAYCTKSTSPIIIDNLTTLSYHIIHV